MQTTYCDGCKKEIVLTPHENRIGRGPGEWYSITVSDGSRTVGQMDLCADCMGKMSPVDRIAGGQVAVPEGGTSRTQDIRYWQKMRNWTIMTVVRLNRNEPDPPEPKD
jgi:hypothetical protein